MMDDRKRPMDGLSGPSSSAGGPPAKKLQLDPAHQPTINGVHLNRDVKAEPEEDEDDDEQNPAYKGLEVSDWTC